MTLPMYGYTQSGKPIPASPRAPIVASFTTEDLQDAIGRLGAKAEAYVKLDILQDGHTAGIPHLTLAYGFAMLHCQIQEYKRLLSRAADGPDGR